MNNRLLAAVLYLYSTVVAVGILIAVGCDPQTATTCVYALAVATVAVLRHPGGEDDGPSSGQVLIA